MMIDDAIADFNIFAMNQLWKTFHVESVKRCLCASHEMREFLVIPIASVEASVSHNSKSNKSSHVQFVAHFTRLSTTRRKFTAAGIGDGKKLKASNHGIEGRLYDSFNESSEGSHFDKSPKTEFCDKNFKTTTKFSYQLWLFCIFSSLSAVHLSSAQFETKLCREENRK